MRFAHRDPFREEGITDAEGQTIAVTGAADGFDLLATAQMPDHRSNRSPFPGNPDAAKDAGMADIGFGYAARRAAAKVAPVADGAGKGERALCIVFGQRSAQYADALTSLCEIERMGGELGAAAEHCGQVLDVTSGMEGNIATRARIAQAKLDFETGAYSKTEQALSEILSKPEAAAMPRNLLADSLWFSALASRKLRFMDKSRTQFQKLVALHEGQWGAKHPQTAWAYSDLAELLIEMRLFDEAGPLLAKAIPIFSATLGPEHPDACSPVYAVTLIDIAKERWGKLISARTNLAVTSPSR